MKFKNEEQEWRGAGGEILAGPPTSPCFCARVLRRPTRECAADGAPEYFISRKKGTKKRLPEVKERPRGQEAGPGPEDSSELNWDFALARTPFFSGSVSSSSAPWPMLTFLCFPFWPAEPRPSRIYDDAGDKRMADIPLMSVSCCSTERREIESSRD